MTSKTIRVTFYNTKRTPVCEEIVLVVDEKRLQEWRGCVGMTVKYLPANISGLILKVIEETEWYPV